MLRRRMRLMGKRIIVFMLLLTVSIQPVTVLAAAQVDNGAVYPITTNEIEGWPQGSDVSSETAVVMDADTNVILYNKGMHERRYPASITKIMTALLALENCSLDEQVVYTDACLADQTPDSSSMGAQVGEIMTMEQCLYVLLMKSANDVATQIGVHIAGSLDAFAEMMNARAQELGCTDTHFVNASGMPDDNQYTSAYDMALIFQKAIKNEKFREIIATQSYTLPPTNMCAEARTYTTHHVMTSVGAEQYYEGCFGGKTGGSDASKNTLVSGAERDGITLIAVSMRTDILSIWKDHGVLFDYGYNNFTHMEVDGGILTVPKDVQLDQLDQVDTEDGRTQYEYHGQYVGVGDKVTPTQDPTETATETPAGTETPAETETTETVNNSGINITYYVIFVLIALILIALIALFVTLIRRR